MSEQNWRKMLEERLSRGHPAWQKQERENYLRIVRAAVEEAVRKTVLGLVWEDEGGDKVINCTKTFRKIIRVKSNMRLIMESSLPGMSRRK